jgi:hypothetical protein
MDRLNKKFDLKKQKIFLEFINKLNRQEINQLFENQYKTSIKTSIKN